MLKVCVIGIGNAGNQVAELAKKEYNIPGLAINSSEKDISTLCNVNKLVLGDEKGAGKDRNIAKEFMRQNIQSLLKQDVFKKLMEENEVVFVVSSTGGGTGSGMSPVLRDILSKVYPTKKFIPMHILPPIKESIAAQQNTIEYLKEMRTSNPPYMSYDNQKRSNKTTSEMMEDVNREIVEDMVAIRGDYQYPTPYNSIDEKDMSKILETPGRIVIAKAYGMKEKDLDEKSLEDILINNLKNNSVATELERDRIVKRMGLITNLNSNMHRVLDTNVPLVKELVGEPVEGFEHIYVNKETEDPNRIILVMSGLSVPDDRVQKIVQRIEEATELLKKTKSSSVLDDVKVDFLDDLRENPNKDCQQEINVNDIFSQYMK